MIKITENSYSPTCGGNSPSHISNRFFKWAHDAGDLIDDVGLDITDISIEHNELRSHMIEKVSELEK